MDNEHPYREVGSIEIRQKGAATQKFGLGDLQSWVECETNFRQLAMSAGLSVSRMDELFVQADYPFTSACSNWCQSYWEKGGGTGPASRAYLENAKRIWIEKNTGP